MKLHEHPENLRRVAILVASVEDALAGQLLESLPETLAAEVRQLVDQLGEIDPGEQEEVLRQFQQSTSNESSVAKSLEVGSQGSEAVELEIDASLERQMERLEEYERALESQQAKEATDSSESDKQTSQPQRSELIARAAGPELAEQLRDEHPQVIALVLSRLNETQAAETLSHLPSATQSLVIQRLVYSHPALDDAVEELEIQLAERLLQRHRLQEYFHSGSNLARRILQNAPENERRVILDQLQQHDPTVATALNEEAADSPEGNFFVQNRLAAAYEASSLEVLAESTETDVAELESVAWEPTSRIEDSSEEPLDPQLLDTLGESELKALLAVASEQVVQVYLGSASEQQFRQLTAGLPRREAKRLRSATRKQQPSPESVELAHQSLLQIAKRAGLFESEAVS